MNNRQIEVTGLSLWTRIGVPAKERAEPQHLLADLTFCPNNQDPNLADDLTATVDYAAVVTFLEGQAKTSRCQLLEVLAEELVAALFKNFFVSRIELRLKKFILPQTEYVAVCVMRDKEELV